MTDGSGRGLSRRSLASWLGGLAGSFLLAWLVAPCFVNSGILWAPDDVLGRYVRQPGATVIWRSEGWGTTRFGPHGMVGDVEGILAGGGPVFVFWGDSHAEAFQVDDVEKGVAVYNAQAAPGAPQGVVCAESGLSVADYAFDIPKLERAYPQVVGHVILLNGMRDVLPQTSPSVHARFAENPWRLEPGTYRPNANGLRWGPVIRDMRLEFLYDLCRRVKDHSFRFTPGTAEASGAAEPDGQAACNPERMREGWRFLLRTLRGQGRNVAFLYCPMVPAPGNGGVVAEDPDKACKALFREVCADQGVGFVDLTDAFNGFYRNEAAFPRGFPNSRAGEGHLNRDGHRLVAGALADLFGEADR